MIYGAIGKLRDRLNRIDKSQPTPPHTFMTYTIQLCMMFHNLNIMFKNEMFCKIFELLRFLKVASRS